MDIQDQGPDAIGATMTEIIRETIATTGTLDYQRVIDQLTKNYTAKAVVCAAMGIADFTPEMVLQHLIDDAVSLEDRIIGTAKISPMAARCFAEMIEDCELLDSADEALVNALEDEIRVACERVWGEMRSMNAGIAAEGMLATMPVLAGFLDETSRAHLIGLFAGCYTTFLAEQPAALSAD